MTTDSMTTDSDATLFLREAWFDPIEVGIREQIRGFIEGLIEEEWRWIGGATDGDQARRLQRDWPR
jgi:hypothetical protein